MRQFALWLWIPVAVLVIPAAAVSVEGADPAKRTIGPEDAVRIALENNPMLRAADEQVQAAQADRRYANSGYLPHVEVSEDWFRSNNPVFVFSSKLGQGVFTAQDFALDSLNNPDAYTNSQTRLSVYQSIWNGGMTGSGKKAATAGIAAAESERDRTRDEVVFGALKAFWNLVLAHDMLRVVKDAEAAAEANLALASELVDSGMAVPSDRMSAEVRVAEVKSLRIRAESGVEVAHAALLGALGLEDGSRFEPRPPDALPSIVEGDSLQSRLEQAYAERADLATLDHRIEQANMGVKRGRSGYYPEFGALGRYELNGEQLFGADGTNWMIGLTARWSPFSGNGTKAQTARARADLARLEAMRTAMRQGIRVGVEAAWAERESARRRLEVSSAALASADEALRIVRERYGEGMTVMVELLGTEAAYTQAQVNHAAAQSELWLAQAALDLASGADPLGTDFPQDVPDQS